MTRLSGLALSTAIILSGCSTYQLSGEYENVAIERVAGDTFTVSFCGNAYMNKEDVDKYALQRAAETAISKGYTYFLVLTRSDNSRQCNLKTEEPSEIMPENMPEEVSPDESPLYVRPNVNLRFQCFSKGQKIPEGAVDAHEFLKNNFPGLIKQGRKK